ncbi:MAG: AbrB/MazE/SpoVT family DNA-binding domain-containing protein [Pseudomonadota bacterium]
MKVAKWGNALAVRLPARLVKELGLKEGDEIDFAIGETGEVRVEKADPWAKVRHLFGRVPADYKFDREEANERG